MRRKVAILIGLIVVASIVVFAVTKFMGKDDSSETGSEQPVVTVQGASEATELDPSDNAATKQSIADMVELNVPGNDTAYTAIVREGSIVRSTTSSGQPKLQYLVDIPEFQRTFAVEREGDANSDFASLYVRCPQNTDLRYAAKDCQEIE